MPQPASDKTPKSGPVRPPPFPASYAPGGAPLASAKAFVAIRWMRLSAWARRHKAIAAAAGAAVVLAAGAGAAIALDVFELPEVGLDLAEPARTGDGAEARRDLGHAQWAGKKRRAALASYRRALAMDPDVADERMIANLVAALGTGEARRAEALLVKHRLVAAQEPLERLVGSPRHAVRWAAVRTLDKLGKGTRANWEVAYIRDLDSSECEVRRKAVDKLGAIGTRRAVAALKSARKEDEKTGGLFRSPCLGDRLDDAEQKILARR